jgi:2-polyprenyl-3-methyl-5-hydroxy-6-metoxy-1,4-benzoquinol methylase
MALYKDKQDFIHAVISPNDIVVDVGFWGQGVNTNNPWWVHKLLKARAKKVYGFDLDFDENLYQKPLYFKANAESYIVPEKCNIVFAGDLIEHLSNPGLFLEVSAQALLPDGKLIVTTPNTFNLFNMMEKITKDEPTVNIDHTCYFNKKTLKQLFSRYGLVITDISYLYTLHTNQQYKESWKKKVQNVMYWMLSKCTNKFIETIVVTAQYTTSKQ